MAGTLEVRLWSLFIQRAAFLWTLSSMVLCLSRCGSQMIAAYSRDDLTVERYAIFFSSAGLDFYLLTKLSQSSHVVYHVQPTQNLW